MGSDNIMSKINCVSLYYTPINKTVGCKKVYQNLIIGLNQLGINVAHNSPSRFCGCLHGSVLDFCHRTLPDNMLIGPEIMVLPTEDPSAFEKYKSWVQPAQWVIDYMITFKQTNKNIFYVWPVGINTEQFSNAGRGINFEYDCFIYYKNITVQTPIEKLNRVKHVCDSIGFKYVVLQYGSYNESYLVEMTKKCRFGIFLTGTESQGLAIMEVMSSGVPVLVVEEKNFLYSGYTFTNENVSACPYFDDRCGMKTTIDNIGNDIKLFIENIKSNKYNPREYILENHTLMKGAEKYVKILEEVNP
jgi:hypothetical protein